MANISTMTLHQLACLCALVDCELRVARTAERLHTTQPAVSKMIRALELQVGGDIFLRNGHRLVGLTSIGQEVLALARRAVTASSEIASLAQRRAGTASGTLRLATTHIHARYVLLPVIQRFARRFPEVSLAITLGTPAEIAARVEQGLADLGFSTLSAPPPAGVLAVPCHEIHRCVITPPGHPLLAIKPLTLAAMAQYPLVAYDESFSSGQVVQAAFQREGLTPRILLRASEAGIVKAYVAAGLGIAVIQERAVDRKRDSDLRVLKAAGLFPASRVYLTLRRDSFLPGFVEAFVAMLELRDGTLREMLRAGSSGSASGPQNQRLGTIASS